MVVDCSFVLRTCVRKLEINIDSDLRTKMRSYYLLILNNINNENEIILDKSTFVQLWSDLLLVCDESWKSLYISILRCPDLFD